MTQLHKIPYVVLQAMTFRRFSVPEMFPMLHLIHGKRFQKNFGVSSTQFYLILIVDILQKKHGVAFNKDILAVSKLFRQNVYTILMDLAIKGYVNRERKNGKLCYTITRKGLMLFHLYQRYYRKETLRLLDLGIKWEDYHDRVAPK
jgi:predicted transcriptional regulator